MTTQPVRLIASPTWTVRVYGLAFTVSVIVCLALKPTHTFSALAFTAAVATTAVVCRLFARVPVPLVLPVAITAIALVWDPLGSRMFNAEGPVATAVQAAAIWPECFVLLIGARLISEWSRQAHDRQATLALAGPSMTTEQSVTAAALTGAALAILTFSLVPLPDGAPSALSVSGLLQSALRGATSVHVAILFASGTALALIGGGFVRCWREWRAFLRLRRAARTSVLPSAADAADWVADQADGYASTATAIYLAGLLTGTESDLRTDAAAVHHDAARQFLRRLLGLLPLLGFLGTIVGLAAAIAGLPHGLSGGVDLTASLGGLAIKFETTFLGLTAYLIGSLLTNLLDRLEADAGAGLLQLAEAINHARD
jgi:biopolymer transport protein ExbB/TolQ